MSNHFLYHGKSDEFKGETIYPLNQLKIIYPEIFDLEVSKYQGRVELLERQLPILNCNWNDVIHLSPINPHEIYKALVKIGFNPRPSVFFKIPIEKIKPKQTIIYEYQTTSFDKNTFKHFDVENFTNLHQLDDGVLKYYQDCFNNKSRPLLFHLIPHVLTLDTISTNDLELIDWSEMNCHH